MSTKEIVQDLLQNLPKDVSLHDVAQETQISLGSRGCTPSRSVFALIALLGKHIMSA